LWDKRSGRPDEPGLAHSTQPVEAYANVEQAELFLNNQSLGVKKFKHHKALWQVPFSDGSNLLELRSTKGNKTIKDFLSIDFHMQPYHLEDTLFPFQEIAVNVGAHFYFIDESKNDYLWVPDKPYEKGSWGYTGGKMYLRDFEEVVGSNRNILGTGIDPIYQTQRYGLNGYRFDVPDGRYEVTLHFSELLSGWLLEQYLEHEQEEVAKDQYRRLFSVTANDKALLTGMDLAGHYGANRAVVKEFIVDVKDGKGLQLNFEARSSVPVLNGIQVRRIYP
jgi:beta-galactosidase